MLQDIPELQATTEQTPDNLAQLAASLTPEQVQQLVVNYAHQTADLKQIKDTVLKLLTELGVLNADGELRENISLPKITGNLMPMIMGGGAGLREKFGYVLQLAPVLMKYKEL